MSFLALILGCFMSGSTVLICPNSPLDYDMVGQISIQEQQPLLKGKATRYDYQLNGNRWSKTHNTCALRIRDRYKTYKVCSLETGKCIKCYHNDYGPAEYTNKVIDLSSHAFRELGLPLSRGVADVEIYNID